MSAKETEESVVYPDSKSYWSQIPATVNGMLGGFGHISHTDIQGSRQFLKHIFYLENPPGQVHALDCGAGIGRISKYLLSKIFQHVDMVEENKEFLIKARSYLGPRSLTKIDKFYSSSLQDFMPEEKKYDVIWIQWVVGYLMDEELIKFFERCKTGLKPNGVIIVKENITSTDVLEMDVNDSSVTRPLGQFREIFSKAGLDCIKQLKQHNFPRGLFPVIMFALKCDSSIDKVKSVPNMDTDHIDTPTLSIENCTFACNG